MTRKVRTWTGDSTVQTIASSGTIANVIQLVETVTTDQPIIGVVTHKATYLNLHVRRLTAGSITGVDFMVWLGKTVVGTSGAAQAQQPQDAGKFPHADSDIMYAGGLTVPPCIRAQADDTLLITQESHAQYFEIHAMRKFDRANHGIFLQIVGGSASVVQVRATWRTLMLV